MAQSRSLYTAIRQCIFGDSCDVDPVNTTSYTTEVKMPPAPANNEEDISEDIVKTLLLAEKPGKALSTRLDHMVRTCGWRESIARRVLAGLEHAIQTGVAMSPAMREAYEKSRDIAEQFVKEHPVLTAAIVTVIAIGVLCILAPYTLEILGFGDAGPVEGSFAAWWQSLYPDVPARSFFSWLQRLGMKWI